VFANWITRNEFEIPDILYHTPWIEKILLQLCHRQYHFHPPPPKKIMDTTGLLGTVVNLSLKKARGHPSRDVARHGLGAKQKYSPQNDSPLAFWAYLFCYLLTSWKSRLKVDFFFTMTFFGSNFSRNLPPPNQKSWLRPGIHLQRKNCQDVNDTKFKHAHTAFIITGL